MEFLKLIADCRTPFLDKLFLFLTELGGESVVIVLLCLAYWCINKRSAYKIGITYFITAPLIQGLKITFRIDRPWVIDPSFKPVESALSGAGGYSFPSGHVQNITALFVPLGLSVKNVWAKAACFAAVLTVGFSRMYLGVHTPADVLTAFGLTAAVAVAVQLCDIKFGERLSEKSSVIAVSLVMFLVSLGVMIYSFIMYKSVDIESRYITDCCKASGAGMGFAVGYFIEHFYVNFSEKTEKFYQQVIKFAIGLAVVLLLKSVIKSLFGESFFVSTLRYFIIVLWIAALWPMIFKRFIPSVKNTEKKTT